MRRYSLIPALLLIASAAWSTADGPDFWQIPDTGCHSAVTIRAEPGPRAEAIGEIPSGGTCIRNLGCKGGLSL